MNAVVVAMLGLLSVALASNFGDVSALRDPAPVAEACRAGPETFELRCSESMTYANFTCAGDPDTTRNYYPGAEFFLAGQLVFEDTWRFCDFNSFCIQCGSETEPQCIEPVPPCATPTPACEIPTEVCIAAQVDTTLDGAGWDQIQSWITRLIEILEEEYPGRSIKWGGVAFAMPFATPPPQPFEETGAATVDFFNSIGYGPGTARIDKGLRACRDLFSSAGTDGALKKVILITDGNGTNKDGTPRPFSLVRQQADKLKDMGATLFVLDAGVDVNQIKLRQIVREDGVELYRKLSKYSTNKSFRNTGKKLLVCA